MAIALTPMASGLGRGKRARGAKDIGIGLSVWGSIAKRVQH
jgi:hypothetical protein